MKSNKSVPTIQDVAREAGVSPSTVSNVLNRRWRQTSKETRERILEVARRLNYQPNAMAAALRRRSTRTIGLIVTSVLNPFYTAVVRGIQDEARRHGYTTILGNTDDDPEQERDMLNTLRAKQVDGMLIVTTGGCHETIQHVSDLGVPIVMVDRGDPALNLDAVGVDNVQAAENAVGYLIGLGHRRIAIVGGLTIRRAYAGAPAARLCEGPHCGRFAGDGGVPADTSPRAWKTGAGGRGTALRSARAAHGDHGHQHLHGYRRDPGDTAARSEDARRCLLPHV